MNQRALAAEFVGTFMLMSSVLGAAFYSFGAPAGAAGILGVAFSIGLTAMALAYSIGHISGGHFNPAVTLGLVAGGRVKKYLNERGKRILKALDDISARLAAKPAHVALAWLIARPSITAPIASATTLAQLEDLVAGTGLELDRDAVKLLDAASA